MKRVFLAALCCAFAVTATVTTAEAKSNRKPAPRATAKPASKLTAANKVTVTIANFQFTPKTLTVPVGTTVVWNNEGGRHTVQSDSGVFKSDVLTAGKTFEFTFTKAGKFPYHCALHGEAGGKDMAGTVVVTAAKK